MGCKDYSPRPEQGCVETYIFRWALTDQEIDTGLDVTYVAILKIRAMRNNTFQNRPLSVTLLG